MDDKRENKTDAELDPEVLEALESDDETRRSLSEEIANKWDPDKLLRLVSAQAGRGDTLDEATRRRYEKKLGVDLGNVRVYRGEFADEVTKAHSAEALTVGGTGMILMGTTGARSMATASHQALLAHELTHVAQETRGVHRRAYEGEAPLATNEGEAEAEEVEAQEMAEQTGGSSGQDADAERERVELLDKLFHRLVEVFEDEERVYELRNGLDRFRP